MTATCPAIRNFLDLISATISREEHELPVIGQCVYGSAIIEVIRLTSKLFRIIIKWRGHNLIVHCNESACWNNYFRTSQ
jgi:hypothetical protein